jgi:hypothetical protein
VVLPGLLTLGLVVVLKCGKDGGLGAEVVMEPVREADTFAVRRQRLEVSQRSYSQSYFLSACVDTDVLFAEVA